MKQRISDTLRLQVSQRSQCCCEYCLMPEAFLASIFHVDHIRSRKHSGKTILSNLAYACPHCNQNKGSDIATFDDETDETIVRFFNPRKDIWHDHFEINNGEILPKTAIGNATIKILDFNQPERIILRQALIAIGEYPKF
jgi:5-methylcytosine-specific restriction endonuclease McrA